MGVGQRNHLFAPGLSSGRIFAATAPATTGRRGSRRGVHVRGVGRAWSIEIVGGTRRHLLQASHSAHTCSTRVAWSTSQGRPATARVARLTLEQSVWASEIQG